MEDKKKAAAEKRHMRFELSEKQHDEAKIMRARTNLSNEELWIDMMRVYKAHPKDWISARKRAKAL